MITKTRMSVDRGDDVAHAQRRLHHLGGDAAGELVLVEAHALREHHAVEVPAQAHREVAEQRLVLQRRLQRHQHRAAREDTASSSSVPPSRAHSCAGCTWASQSTTWPSIANSSASNAPMTAVSSVIASTKRRTPAEHAQMKGKTPLGGGGGSDVRPGIDESFEVTEQTGAPESGARAGRARNPQGYAKTAARVTHWAPARPPGAARRRANPHHSRAPGAPAMRAEWGRTQESGGQNGGSEPPA